MEKKKTLGETLRKASHHHSTEIGIGQPPHKSEVSNYLQGDLKEKPIGWLLKAAKNFEATGHLIIADAVVIQIGLGRILHAHSPVGPGRECIMEIFLWPDGKVRFKEGAEPESTSIDEDADSIIWDGEAFIKANHFLEEQGLNEHSILQRTYEKLTKDQIIEYLQQGEPIPVELQLEFFSNVYGTMNLKDIVAKMKLPPSRWPVLVENLMRLGLVLTPDGRSLMDEKIRKVIARTEEFPMPTYALPDESQTIDALTPDFLTSDALDEPLIEEEHVDLDQFASIDQQLAAMDQRSTDPFQIPH
ncbi:MAG: DUF4388 domain-containing protein, partial [Cyanobacteria bacterium]|nr:DUF4388 domain-containing protein [Cyanobacteriota bacterium]